MIGWERRVLLRHYLDEGLTVTEISREPGISRQTIYRWINEGELDRDLEEVRYGPRPPVPTKLDAYKAIVRERLEEYPELTAVRLLAEIRAAGYPGGYTQLREYVRKVRPRAPADPLVRFETDPGVQGQVDFAHFRFPWGRRYLLLVVLGYSRLLWLRFYRRQDMPTLLRGLEAAFGFFGGVPRELLFDQMKSVIVRDLRGEVGRVTENAEFLRFAAHRGFRPRACRPYHLLALPAEREPETVRRLASGAPGHHRTASPGRVRPPRRGGLMTPAKRPGRRDRIRAQLADLKLPGALEALDPILSGVDGGRFTAAEAIEKLLAAQIGLRNNRRLQAAMRASRLPAVKTLADFDFSFQPSIKREQIDSLHELSFLDRKENVVFLGPRASGRPIWPSRSPSPPPSADGASTTAPWPTSSPLSKRHRPQADSSNGSRSSPTRPC